MLTREEKLKRKKGLGGSDIAAVFGLSRYKTPYQLWLDKTTEEVLDDEEESPRHLIVRSCLEEGICKAYTKIEKGSTIEFKPEMKFHKDFPWLLGNVDAFANHPKDGRVILEIKTSNRFLSKNFGDEGSDEIPHEYLLQVATYCMIWEIEIAHIAVVFDNFDMKIFKYKRARSTEQSIFERTRDFWFDHVKANKPPEYTTRDDLDVIYKMTTGKTVEADGKTFELVEKLKQLKAQQKFMSDEAKELQQQIKLYMKDAEFLTHLGDKVVKLSEYDTTRVDTKSLKENKPNIYKQFTKTTTSKRFNLR